MTMCPLSIYQKRLNMLSTRAVRTFTTWNKSGETKCAMTNNWSFLCLESDFSYMCIGFNLLDICLL